MGHFLWQLFSVIGQHVPVIGQYVLAIGNYVPIIEHRELQLLKPNANY
jgi:hypothetical protein